MKAITRLRNIIINQTAEAVRFCFARYDGEARVYDQVPTDWITTDQDGDLDWFDLLPGHCCQQAAAFGGVNWEPVQKPVSELPESTRQLVERMLAAPCVSGEPTGELQVLKSAAGYYVGHLYFDDEMGGWFPYDRQSEGYWREAAAAEAYRKALSPYGV